MPKRGSWIRVVDPTKEELAEIAESHSLDLDLLVDGIDLYEAPRIEYVDNILYIYVRYCRPAGEYTSTHPLLIVVTDDMLFTVSRIESDPISKLVESGKVTTTQKLKTVLQILEELNRGYRTHLHGVTRKILSTRSRLQRTIVNNKDILSFIDLEEDLNEFLAALQPYGVLLHALKNGRYLKLHEEDKELIEDLELSSGELTELTKSKLKTIQNMREAYSAISTNDLNKSFKQLTSIAIFLAVPTLIGGMYGMNVLLPFQEDQNAFWFIMVTTLFVITIFIFIFRKRRWL